ncbi:MAG: rhodanese-like domain-containing protein, partial [Bradyrhizobium sp.]
MPYEVAAFYQFAALPDFRHLRDPLRALCAALKLRGSVLLAHEGINGTLAGSSEAIGELVNALRNGDLFGGRLDHLELKFSAASAMPFQRLKIRLKKEIVTLGDRETDPTRQVGIYVDPADWNDLIAAPDTLLIDTRNAFEVAMGTFEGAVDPGIKSFGQFKDFAARHLDPRKHRKVAMFCTGGIRCEKASSYLLSRGFTEVYHLKGG